MNKVLTVLVIVALLASGVSLYKAQKVQTALVVTDANASTTLAAMNQFAGQVVQAINNLDGRIKTIEAKK